MQRQLAYRGSETQSRILGDGHIRTTGRRHGARAVEQPLKVDAEEGGGHKPEEAESRIPATDVARVHKDGAIPPLQRLALERRALIGDGHEVGARVLAAPRLEALEEVGLEARRLGRASGLAGHEKERAVEVESRLQGEDCGRVGRVEHVQIEEPLGDAEDIAEHLGREARAAHAE